MSNKSIKKLSTLLEDGHVVQQDLTQLTQVIDTFSLAISDEMYSLIDKNNLNDPIKKQFIPSTDELIITQNELADPIGDQTFEAVKGIIHRYPDRCLLLPVQICTVYCRFCFRREKVSHHDNTLNKAELDLAIDYIASQPSIWEVILTGGDPLILKPLLLQSIVERLTNISHVNVIRIHTRIPVVEPTRINDDLLKALKSSKPIYIAIHANHASEFTENAVNALAQLSNHGIPMISQTTLLKDVNDNIEALSNLMRTFVINKIKPYYLHHPDLAKGTSHFRVSIKDGQALMRQLRGRFSGLCQPTYVLDIPGGFGKAPIGPQYVNIDSKNCICTIEDYQGDIHPYQS